jgi:hypothetical protein
MKARCTISSSNLRQGLKFVAVQYQPRKSTEPLTGPLHGGGFLDHDDGGRKDLKGYLPGTSISTRRPATSLLPDHVISLTMTEEGSRDFEARDGSWHHLRTPGNDVPGSLGPVNALILEWHAISLKVPIRCWVEVGNTRYDTGRGTKQ